MYPQDNDCKARFVLRLRKLLRAIISRLPETQKRKLKEKANILHQNISPMELTTTIPDFLTKLISLAENFQSLVFGSPTHYVTKDILKSKCSYQAFAGAIRARRHTAQPTPVRYYRHPTANRPFNERDTSTIKPHHRRKGSSRMTAPLLYVVVLLLAIFILPTTAKYTVYSPEPGLYVEHVGTGKVNRGTFRIDVPFSYVKLEEDLNSVSNTIQQMHQLCENMKSQLDDKSCNYLLFHLSQLEKQAVRIKENLDSYTSRQQRSLGKFLTSLFKVNENAYWDISQFHMKQRELGGASQYQTKTVLSNIAGFNDAGTNITLKLHNFLNKLTETINGKRETSTIHIFSSYQAATNYINEIIDYYTPLLDVQMHRGSLYDLLSPDTIEKTIATASIKLPSDLRILSKPILDTKISRDQDTIYIHGYFPMIDNRNFTLLKVIPIPLKIEGNSYWFLDVPSDIIAVDYDSQFYFYQSDEELRNTMQIQNNEYLCVPKTVRKMEENPSCVIDTIYAQTINNTCEIKRDDITSIIWKELYTVNAWMFITNKATTISVVCDGSRDGVQINNTGILQIPQNCFIQTKKNILTPKREDVIHVLSTYSKYVPVNLTRTSLQSRNFKGVIDEPVLKVINTFRTIQEQVDEFQEQLQGVDVQDIKHQGVVGNVVTGASVVSIILAALVTYRATEAFWKKILPHNCARQTSRSDENSRLIQSSDSGD